MPSTKVETPARVRPNTKGQPILQRACGCGNHTMSGSECAECSKKRLTPQCRATNQAEPSTVPPIVHEVLRSPGQPLDHPTRAFMESRFDHDFSRVRVHTDAKAAESARAVRALAYTVGRDVVFGAGQYTPGTSAGRKLLAHELAHAVQQGLQPGHLGAKLAVDTSGDPYELEADQVAERVNSNAFLLLGPPHAPISVSQRGSPYIPILQRKAECSLKHVEDECKNAAASCMTVDEECKKRYPKPEDIDAMIKKGRDKAKELATEAPNASANMLHFLNNTGTEKVMPTGVFESHKETKAALLRHREKFLEGAKKRLEAGTLAPGAESEQMVWTDTANAFSFLSKDDLGYAVGGYTLCSKARARAKKIDTNKFEISFVEWTVQAFDCYNWDPGKGVGIPGASDTDMCCIENAGKAKHFRVRTDEWKNTYAESTKAGEVTATVPSAPKAPVPAPAPPVFPPTPPPPPAPPGK